MSYFEFNYKNRIAGLSINGLEVEEAIVIPELEEKKFISDLIEEDSDDLDCKIDLANYEF